MAFVIQFVSVLLNIEVSEPLGVGIRLTDKLYLSNDRQILQRIVDPAASAVIGKLEYDYIHSSNLFVYGEWLLEDNSSIREPISILNEHLRDLRSLLILLWLLRDNAAEFESSFLFERNGLLPLCVASNCWSSMTTRHDLKTTLVQFSQAEILGQYAKFGKELWSIEAGDLESQIVAAYRQGRLERAFQFLGSARGTVNIFVKIAHYCSALEALFCSDSNEISHKLAERIAVFLETSSPMRVRLFRQIKEAYGLRSKVIHGAKPRCEAEDLLRICATLDEVVRRVLNRIIAKDDWKSFFETANAEVFEKRFLEMQF